MWSLNNSKNFSASVAEYKPFLGLDAPATVKAYPSISSDRSATPLHSLRGLASALGLGAIYAKEEGRRLGLGSFKALGGSYAVARVVQSWAEEALGRVVHPSELVSPGIAKVVSGRVVACATDGNHGLSVAAGAKLFGCSSVVFVHARVDPKRLDTMRRMGAEVIVVDGNYDDSVDECLRVSKEAGWQVVSDTSWPGYELIPSQTMQGYTVMADECACALESMAVNPTHLFVQAGCGGLAAAVIAHFKFRSPRNSIKAIVVEPDRANCILQSALAGERVRIDETRPTSMGMLECCQPSLVAWRILERVADAFMDIPDEASTAAVQRLANPFDTDNPIGSTESGASGVAGLQMACADRKLRETLGLDENSTVLVFITEGESMHTDSRHAEELSA